MIRRRAVPVALLLTFLASAGPALAQAPEDAGQAAAESWLKLVDNGNYPASWDQAAGPMKGAVKQGEWARMLGSARAPLGPLVSRKVKSRVYTEKAPTTTRVVGGRVYTWSGPGRYVVIKYETAFAKKSPALETVITMAGPEGTWKVSGYSVR